MGFVGKLPPAANSEEAHDEARLGCLPASLFRLRLALLKTLDDRRLRAFETFVALHLGRIELDGQLQVPALHAPVGAYVSTPVAGGAVAK
jgi:hypothetical protein